MQWAQTCGSERRVSLVSLIRYLFIYLFIGIYVFKLLNYFFSQHCCCCEWKIFLVKKQQHIFAISNRDRAELAERHPGPHLQSDILGHIQAEPNRCLSLLLIRFRLTHLCLVGSSALSLWLGPFPNWECLAGLCCCRVLLGFLSLCRQCRP